ncbi:hypothetical protein [Peribacillus butanolivorans]|uniref:hypothetical protein n=1 Tax=Peribacillus butanolivorans TaxID=421767 RepID=UPI0036585435
MSSTYTQKEIFLQSGSFPVVGSHYKNDPDWTAAITAYEWIQQMKREHASSDDFRIDKVFITETMISRS